MTGFFDFLRFIFSGGMLFFTIPLLLMILYWLIFVFGMVDIDWLDAANGTAEAATAGLAEGAAEAVAEGAAEALAEGAAEALAEGAAEALAEGAAEALAEGAAEALAEGASGGLVENAAAHLHHGLSQTSEALAGGVMAGEVAGSSMAHTVGRGVVTPLLSRSMSFLNIGHVPTTIVASIFFTAFWLIGFFSMVWLPASRWPSVPPSLIITLRLILTAIASYFVAGLAARPLRHIFGSVTVHAHKHLVGQICTVRSSTVDSSFGEGDLTIKGSFLTLSLRTQHGETLTKGDSALITGYDENQDVYFVQLCR